MPCGGLIHAADNAVGVRACGAAQLSDRLGHRTDGMLPQQFQHAHVLPHSEAAAVPIFQPCSQLAKRRRKFPLAVDVRVIQRGRASTQRYQIMQRIENLVTRFLTALMRGHDLITVDDLDAIDVAFHRHGPEGRRARDAVRDVVEACELILSIVREISVGSRSRFGYDSGGPI